MSVELILFEIQESLNIPQEEFLSSPECTQVQAISHESRLREYLQTRYHVKQHLQKKINLPLNEITFEKRGEGKPYCPQFKGDLNWSHSHNWGTAIFSEQGRVGVDLEFKQAKSSFTALSHRILTSYERDILEASSDKAEVFWKFWTGKEALLKANASGGFKDALNIQLDPLQQKIITLPPSWGDLNLWTLQWDEPKPQFLRAAAWYLPATEGLLK